MRHTGRVIVANLTCKTTWAGILLALIYKDQSSKSYEPASPREVSPLLPEMVTAGLRFRIQWILWRLLGIDLLAVVKWYTHSTSFLEH